MRSTKLKSQFSHLTYFSFFPYANLTTSHICPLPLACSKDLTKDLVSAHTTLNDKHERLADFFKNAYEAEVTSRKEMQADLIAATAVATANEAQVKGLEVALIEVRHQNEYLTKLTEALRAEQLAMVEKVMTQLARW